MNKVFTMSGHGDPPPKTKPTRQAPPDEPVPVPVPDQK